MHASLTRVRFVYVKPRHRNTRRARHARAAFIAIAAALLPLLFIAATR